MINMEEICLTIISNVGTARSDFIEAIQLAKSGEIEEARKLMKQGHENFIKGHQSHAELIALEASGQNIQGGLLLMHAEDQLMSAEGFSILAEEFIDLYIKINEKL